MQRITFWKIASRDLHVRADWQLSYSFSMATDQTLLHKYTPVLLDSIELHYGRMSDKILPSVFHYS